jgi:hypothetical protein
MPHCIVQVRPFHWQVASWAQSALFVFNPQEILQLWLDGFQAQPL